MTPDAIKQRLEDAGRTLMMLPIPKNGYPQGGQAAWPDIQRTYQEWFTAQVMADRDNVEEMMAGRNVVRVRPQQAQIREMDEVLDWIWHIKDGRRRRIVTLRSLISPVTDKHVYGWRRLGRQLGMHENSIRYQYDNGINDILCGLNAGNAICRQSHQNRLKITSIR